MSDSPQNDSISPPILALPILALVSDLIFSSKIIAEARAAGRELQVVRQPGQLAEKAGSRLIVDLNLPGAIAAAAAWGKASGKMVVGFVGHTDQGTIAKARAAGIDQIVPRSRFVQILPELVKGGE